MARDEEISRCFVNSLNNTVTTTAPYDHWIVENSLPKNECDALKELPFPEPQPLEKSGTREANNATRVYFDTDNQKQFNICSDIAAAFQSDAVVSAIQTKCGTNLDGSYLRIEYAQDIDGFWLVPHTDIGPKLFTMLLYISDNPQHAELGTDIYADEETHFGRSPFSPNTSMIFIPSDHSWHGFEPREIHGVRKSVIINYVTADWRAREQLAFPDRPISS